MQYGPCGAPAPCMRRDRVLRGGPGAAPAVEQRSAFEAMARAVAVQAFCMDVEAYRVRRACTVPSGAVTTRAECRRLGSRCWQGVRLWSIAHAGRLHRASSVTADCMAGQARRLRWSSVPHSGRWRVRSRSKRFLSAWRRTGRAGHAEYLHGRSPRGRNAGGWGLGTCRGFPFACIWHGACSIKGSPRRLGAYGMQATGGHFEAPCNRGACGPRAPRVVPHGRDMHGAVGLPSRGMRGACVALALCGVVQAYWRRRACLTEQRSGGVLVR